MNGKNYYISYQFSNGYQNGFGAIAFNNLVINRPDDIFLLSNKIAEIMKLPKNSVVILFFKEFDQAIENYPKFG